MQRFLFSMVLVLTLDFAGAAGAQNYPILDKIADKVVAKYQTSSCQQLAAERGQPKGQAEQRVVQMLREDANMRAEFLNRVAAPIANKMFECGFIP